jgi:hypothetical protein
MHQLQLPPRTQATLVTPASSFPTCLLLVRKPNQSHVPKERVRSLQDETGVGVCMSPHENLLRLNVNYCIVLDLYHCSAHIIYIVKRSSFQSVLLNKVSARVETPDHPLGHCSTDHQLASINPLLRFSPVHHPNTFVSTSPTWTQRGWINAVTAPTVPPNCLSQAHFRVFHLLMGVLLL